MRGSVSIVGQILMFMVGITIFSIVVLGFENIEEGFLNVGEELAGRQVSRYVAFSVMDAWLAEEIGKNASVVAYIDVPYTGGNELKVELKAGSVCASTLYQEACKRVPLNITLEGDAYTLQRFRIESITNGLKLTGGPFG